MRNETLGGYASIPAFVGAKLDRLNKAEPTFGALFELMFSERGNIMYERSDGYRIRSVTYGEAREAVCRAQSALSARLHDVPPQSVVGLYMQNGEQWIEVFWAILACGFCPLLMNLRLDTLTLEQTLRRSGAAAVISDGQDFSVRTLRADSLFDGEAQEPSAPFGEEILVMSSGTSSHVKLCAYTAAQFRSLLRDSMEIIRRCKPIRTHYEGRLKLLAFLPFYHVFGLIALYLWFGFFSRTFVHLPDLAPQTILGTIRRHKVTHIFAVPLFWETVYGEAMRTIRQRGAETLSRFEKGLIITRKLSAVPPLAAAFSRAAFREVRENLFGESVQFMITGGSEIKCSVLEFFNAIGYRLANGYGMTEIGITSVELGGDLRVLSSGSVGRPLASVEYDLSDEGELLVRGDSLARYLIEDGVRTETGGWFHTGDLAERCFGDRWRILGRMDDLIAAASGENLNPNLIEPRFEVGGVRRVCLIADADGTPTLLASVGRNLPAERLDALSASLRGRLAELKLSGQIGRVVLVEEDLLGEGDFKLNRGKLARAFAAGELHEATASVSREGEPDDETFTRIRELFAAALGKSAAEIGAETDFFLDGGGSSLDYFAMITQLREEFSVEFPTAEGESLSTPLALYRFVRGECR